MARLLSRAGRLVMRAGKFVYTTCAACCNIICITYWQADPCPPPPRHTSDACGPLPPPPPTDSIYIRTDAICYGRPIKPRDTILVDGVCYTVTPFKFKRPGDTCNLPALPNGARTVDSAECLLEGCQSPPCISPVGNIGLASSCQEDGIPVYFCKSIINRCVYTNLGPPTGLRYQCVRLDPNAPIANPPPGTIIVRSLDGLNLYSTCCECEAALSFYPCQYCRPGTRISLNGQTVETPGPPCCYDSRHQPLCKMLVSGRFEQWLGAVYVVTVVAPQLASCNDPLVRYVKNTYINGVRDRPEEISLGPFGIFGGCTRTHQMFLFNSCDAPDVTCISRDTCTESTRIVSHGNTTDNGIRITSTMQLIDPLPPGKPCAGDCEASSLKAGLVGTPRAIAAVPFEEWPAPARLVALRKQPGDKGVGDTIEREAGAAGIAFKVAMKAVGIDCGCAGRKADYNARFPYT